MQEYRSRVNKATRLMNQRKLDGLVIYSDGPCVMLHPSYFYYFSGLKPLGSNSAIVISKSGDVVVLVKPHWDSIRASKKPWISDVRGSTHFAQDLADVMYELKVTGAVGIMGSKQMTEDIYTAIKKQADIRLAEDIIEEVAREKTEREIDNIRNTAKIADIGFKAFLQYARVGIRQYELAAEIGFAMQSAGTEDNFILLSSGKHSHEMHTPVDKRLEEGDIVIAEITPVCEGQFIQLCNTIILGKPGDVLKEKYNMLLVALEESLKSIRPGVPALSMSKAMNKVISEAGYGKYCYPPYMRARGHGLGPGSTSPGHAIDDNTKANFEKDQVIVAHPNQWLPETGYLACGETVLVTDAGIERLAETETKLYIKEE